MIQLKARCLPPARLSAPVRTDGSSPVEGSCPYLDRNDCRCSNRFALGRLDQMLDICLGPGMAGCFMYHRLKQEEQQDQMRSMSTAPPLVEPTHDGRNLPLRPTGT